jgi:hypothetical protein
VVGVIARMLGWKPAGQSDDSAAPAPSTDDVIAEAARMGIGVSRAPIGMPDGVIDLEKMREANRLRMIEIGRRNAAKAA